MLIVSVPFIVIKNKKYSLHEVLKVLHNPSRSDFTFDDLPPSLQNRLKREDKQSEWNAGLGAATLRPSSKGAGKKSGPQDSLGAMH